MKTLTKFTRGSIRLLSCNVCRAEFPIFEYEIESDADAIGLCSAARCDGGGLILLYLEMKEWQAVQVGKIMKPPHRFLHMIGDGDYRFTHILRIEQQPTPPVGTSFSEFRNNYKSPIVVYSCPCCNKGEATTRSEHTLEDYIKMGGRITALEPLVLAR